MDNHSTKMPLLDTEVKIEYENEVESAINGLYADSLIKEEEIPEPDENYEAVCNLNFCEDKVPKNENTDQSNPQEYSEEEETEVGITQNDTNHSKQSDAYVCGFCNYRTEYKRNLNRHIRTHSDPQQPKKRLRNPRLETQNEKPDQNEAQEYLIEEDSEEGITQSHFNYSTTSNEYACDFCQYKTHRKRNINQHIRTHLTDKRHSCSECGAKFSNAQYLMVHKMRIHSDEKKESCIFCNYKSSNKSQLRKHVMIHTGEKPFSCSVCEYRCRDKSGLMRHMRIHSALTGRNPHEPFNSVDGEYSCSVCGYKCSSANNLMRHKVKRHTDEKPHCCSLCAYRCSSNYDLKKHVMTHTGEKPFSCSVCQFRCRDKSSLSKHFRTHSENPDHIRISEIIDK